MAQMNYAQSVGLLIVLATLILTGGPERLACAAEAALPLRDTVLPPIPAGDTPVVAAVNPITNKIYVANQARDNVTVITEQLSYPIPLVVTILWLPGRTSLVANPAFTFLSESQYTPTASPIKHILQPILKARKDRWMLAPRRLGLDLLDCWTALKIPPHEGGSTCSLPKSGRVEERKNFISRCCQGAETVTLPWHTCCIYTVVRV